MPQSDLDRAAELHADLLREWLSARGPDEPEIRAWLEKARDRHRALEAAQCAAWARGGFARAGVW